MSFLKWTEDLETSIPAIDREHKKLVGLINELYEAMREGKGNEMLGSIIGNLSRYTVTHFKNEEKIFEKFGYPQADNHIRLHQLFVKKVADFEEKFNSNKLSLTLEVLDFLKTWLADHIKGADQSYAKYLKANNII